MAEFTPALAFMLSHEGGYVNNPADIGGETYNGISRKFWPNWPGWAQIEIFKDQGKWLSDRKNCDAALAPLVASFYKINFWDAGLPVFDEIKDQRVANKLFDAQVNLGEATLNHLLDHLPELSALLFLDELKLALVMYYVSRVVARPANKVFLLGWIKRAVDG